MITNDIYALLKERTKASRQTLADLKAVEAEIKSGRYTADAINRELYPKHDAIRRKLESEIAAANKDARKLVSDYQDRLREEDTLDPALLTEDTRLLTAGVKLLPRDITAMLKRNSDNRTMTQLILRYAKENDIDIGRTYYIGNEQAIQDAEGLSGTIDLYTSHWMNTESAPEMLDKFFGIYGVESNESE